MGTIKKRPAPVAGFKPGKSGNPAGRPKKTQQELDLAKACRAKGPEALAVLVELMIDADKDSTRLGAAIAILDRGYGKPKQEQDVNLRGEIEVINPSSEQAKRIALEVLGCGIAS